MNSNNNFLILLEEAQKGNISARNDIIGSHMRLIYKIANSYQTKTYKLDVNDLIHEGVFGIINAIRDFNPERSNNFIKFAAYRIRYAIIDAIRNSIEKISIDEMSLDDTKVPAELLDKARQGVLESPADLPTVEEIKNTVRPFLMRSLIDGECKCGCRTKITARNAKAKRDGYNDYIKGHQNRSFYNELDFMEMALTKENDSYPTIHSLSIKLNVSRQVISQRIMRLHEKIRLAFEAENDV